MPECIQVRFFLSPCRTSNPHVPWEQPKTKYGPTQYIYPDEGIVARDDKKIHYHVLPSRVSLVISIALPIRVAKWRPSKRELVAWKKKPGPHTHIQKLSLEPG